MQLEIFKAGTYRGESYGREFLDKVASNYDPAYHEAPAVLGHPKDNAPAYGWVKRVFVDGDLLKAELDDQGADKNFLEAWKQGKFKKRSASFYLDLNGKGPYLRHVGFLGAMPPEVKGLKDAEFKEGESVTLEFADEDDGALRALLRQFKEWLYTKDQKDDQPQADKGKEPDMTEEKVRELIEGERKKIEAQFSEKLAAKDKEIDELKGRDSARAKETQRKEVREFCEKRLAAGKIAPAWQKAGLEEFMAQLDAVEDENGQTLTVEFGEKKEKKTLRAWFENFIDGLPAVIDLSERAREDGSGKAGAGDELVALAKKRAEDKKISFAVAFSEVQREHRDLANKHLSEVS